MILCALCAFSLPSLREPACMVRNGPEGKYQGRTAQGAEGKRSWYDVKLMLPNYYAHLPARAIRSHGKGEFLVKQAPNKTKYYSKFRHTNADMEAFV